MNRYMVNSAKITNYKFKVWYSVDIYSLPFSQVYSVHSTAEQMITTFYTMSSEKKNSLWYKNEN